MTGVQTCALPIYYTGTLGLPGPGRIYLYTPGKDVQELHGGNYYYGDARINSNGQVVWSGSETSYFETRQIYLFTPGLGVQLLSSGGDPDINSVGQVVWKSATHWPAPPQVFLYRP